MYVVEDPGVLTVTRRAAYVNCACGRVCVWCPTLAIQEDNTLAVRARHASRGVYVRVCVRVVCAWRVCVRVRLRVARVCVGAGVCADDN